jgi:Aminoglycoside adenylyltransferase, C-terminal domain
VSVSLDEIPEVARIAWLRLRDELQLILGDGLVALWAHGGTTFPDRPVSPGDLDTYAILARRPDERSAQRIEDAQAKIARKHDLTWDTWYVLAHDAGLPESPTHAVRPDRRDTSWAIHRAHWLAGRYLPFHGREPIEIVPAPTWAELEVDLRRELEHLERHVVEGDDDPYEATYALFNGSRILHAVETRDVVISKRSAGTWALEHLPDSWHPAIRAAGRAYDSLATPEDAAVLSAAMAPFVAMVRERLPKGTEPSAQALPRWSGY